MTSSSTTSASSIVIGAPINDNSAVDVICTSSLMKSEDRMETDAQECLVTIAHNAKEYSFELDELTPQMLQHVLRLSEPPLALISDDNGRHQVVSLSKKKRLKPNVVYRIVDDSDDVVQNKEEDQKSPWASSGLKTVVQNCILLAQAAYLNSEELCLQVLQSRIKDHELCSLFRSKHGCCVFLLALDEQEGRLYVAFRGSESVRDWTHCNLQAQQTSATNSEAFLARGRMHSGFLDRSLLFPIDDILQHFSSHVNEIVFCGHSMGGAVAAVTCIRMQQEVRRRASVEHESEQSWPSVKCVTFGAPLFGDEELRRFCDENGGLSKNMFHFIHHEDPVPKILACGNAVSSMAEIKGKEIKAMERMHDFDEAVVNSVQMKLKELRREKNDYVTLLNKLAPVIDCILDGASMMAPQHMAAIQASRTVTNVGVSTMNALMKANKESKQSDRYVPIGNFKFVQGDAREDNELGVEQLGILQRTVGRIWSAGRPKENHTFTFKSISEVEKFLETMVESCSSSSAHIAGAGETHSMRTYSTLLMESYTMLKGTYQEVLVNTIALPNGSVHVDTRKREVKVADLTDLLPVLQNAELVMVPSENKLGEKILRVRLEGRNLMHLVEAECVFNLGIPFGHSPYWKKRLLDSETHLVVLEETLVNGMEPNISDFGTDIEVASVFGKTTYKLTKDKMRVLTLSNKQICAHDKVLVVLIRAFHRSMALAQLRRSMHTSADQKEKRRDKILIQLIKLAKLCSEVTIEDKNYLEHLLTEADIGVESVMSNEAEFEKVCRVLANMEKTFQSPLQITSKMRQVIKAIGTALVAVVGGAALGYVVGPGMVVIGALETSSVAAVVTGRVVGGLASSIVMNSLMSGPTVGRSNEEDSYKQILKWLTEQFFSKERKKTQGASISSGQSTQMQVSDLIEEDGVFSLESALFQLYDPRQRMANFKGTVLDQCTEESRQNVAERIDIIEILHDIRGLMAQMCFVGVVGPQDSGKTTLIHTLFGNQLNVSTRKDIGLFSHTTKPVFHEIHPKLVVVDFPGTTGLDDHSETMKICGVMNNVVVVVIPFTGDVDKHVVDELKGVFAAVSSQTRVILCINKCVRNGLPEALENEIAPKVGSISALNEIRTRFVEAINEQYRQAGLEVTVNERDIFFTDWRQASEATQWGIEGVERVRNEIKDFLVRQDIFEGDDELVYLFEE